MPTRTIPLRMQLLAFLISPFPPLSSRRPSLSSVWGELGPRSRRTPNWGELRSGWLSWVCASGAFPVLLWARTPTHALRAAFSRSLLLSVPDARSRSAPGASSPSLSLSAAAAARRAAERAEPKALPPKPQNLLDSSPVVVHANGDDH
ncbi:hypothetical protein GGX14DRAFT_562900 [Mycena pura]|uniref:Uncharacterized protein n=1 Tax=Mycena pura TaxID=153505 RepID=A0AAD6YHX1_9AGAR|nr:hypothetical protein GGX14DRAFT_562900 [Mycena pura]